MTGRLYEHLMHLVGVKRILYFRCYTIGISTLRKIDAHVIPRRLCSGRLRPGSGLLTLLTRRCTAKTHLMRIVNF